MKTIMTKRLAGILLAALMLVTAALPAAAGAYSARTIGEGDAEKLIAFWNQEAYDGLTNGEAVYDHEWPELNYFGGFDPNTMKYDGGCATELVTAYDSGEFELSFAYGVPFYDSFVDEDGDIVSVEGEEEVNPDLYGVLDLAGTKVCAIGRGEELKAGQTHIAALELDGCESLRSVYFKGQSFCRSIDAADCPELERLNAENCACTHIAFSPKELDGAVTVDALGMGAVGVNYSGGTIRLFAYPANGRFVGWYADGECISTERELVLTASGELVAYFGGDADGSGNIDTTDALVLLRAALGVLPEALDQSIADVNNDGVVDTADALELLRFVLGVN